MGVPAEWGGLNIGLFQLYPSISDLHAKYHRNRTKIVEVIASQLFRRGVEWLGWLKFIPSVHL